MLYVISYIFNRQPNSCFVEINETELLHCAVWKTPTTTRKKDEIDKWCQNEFKIEVLQKICNYVMPDDSNDINDIMENITIISVNKLT